MVNEATGLQFPGGGLPTADEQANLEDLRGQHSYLSWLADEHRKCNIKRKGLRPDEFCYPELLSDVVALSGPDL